MNATLDAATILHQGITLATVSNTVNKNIDSLYESITEMFLQCSPSCARNALLTDNNLEAAINLIISNQAQSTTTTQEIYASFEFCNDIQN